VFGKENPNGTTQKKMAEPSSLQGSAKGAVRHTRCMAEHKGILGKPQKSLQSCTMEVHRRQEDAFQYVAGQGVDVLQVIITETTEDGDEPVPNLHEVVESWPERLQVAATLPLDVRRAR
jgi:hypothetical protein